MLSSMDTKQTRFDLVVQLVKCQDDIESIQQKLGDFPFDTAQDYMDAAHR